MSSEVKHYWPEEIVGTGELVVYLQDYAALEAECERLRACRDMEIAAGDSWKKQCQEAEDERDALRAELAALKAVPEGVVVVGVVRKWFVSEWNSQSRETAGWHSAVTLAVDLPDGEPLMTVAQHNARMAEKDAETEALATHHRQWQVRAARTRRELEQELTALRQPVAGNQRAERKAFEAAYLKVRGHRAGSFDEADGEYMSTGMQQVYSGWLMARAALSAPAAGQDVGALVSAGTTLSNIAYNLAQRAGVTLDEIVCEALSSARKSWDATLAAHKAGGES